MCPFKKAFPFVLFLHLLFAVGIFASFAQHQTAEHLFTLLPALGVGEELRVGNTSAEEDATVENSSENSSENSVEPAAEQPEGPRAEIPEHTQPSAEISRSIVPAAKIVPIVGKGSAPSKNVASSISHLSSPASRGSIAGDTPSAVARVGGAMGSDENFGGAITPPIALKKQKPAHVGAAGEVVLDFTINQKGCVENVSVERSDSTTMTAAVMAVLPKWRFVPAKAEGKTIAMRVRQVVRF